MPILYKPRQATMANKDGQKLYHPSVVSTGIVNLEKMSDEIAELSSLSPGDVFNTLKNLVTVMTRHLHSSETVQIDGLGNFTIAMRSMGKGAATADEVSAQQSRVRIRFSPSHTRNTDGTVATRSLITGAQFVKVSGSVGGSGSGSGGSSGEGSGSDEEEVPFG